MLSVPTRWISSAAKRDLPSPKARKSVTSGHNTPLTDTHVDPTPTVHADASSDHKTSLNKPRFENQKDENSPSPDEGKGQLVDYSI